MTRTSRTRIINQVHVGMYYSHNHSGDLIGNFGRTSCDHYVQPTKSAITFLCAGGASRRDGQVGRLAQVHNRIIGLDAVVIIPHSLDLEAPVLCRAFRAACAGADIIVLGTSGPSLLRTDRDGLLQDPVPPVLARDDGFIPGFALSRDKSYYFPKYPGMKCAFVDQSGEAPAILKKTVDVFVNANFDDTCRLLKMALGLDPDETNEDPPASEDYERCYSGLRQALCPPSR